MSLDDQLKEKVSDILKTIYDPEIPVNLVDLGLIYDITVKNAQVSIHMTLTNPGCPVAEQFPIVVKNHISSIPEVTSVNVTLVWDPPWTIDRMSEEARLILGI